MPDLFFRAAGALVGLAAASCAFYFGTEWGRFTGWLYWPLRWWWRGLLLALWVLCSLVTMSFVLIGDWWSVPLALFTWDGQWLR